MRLSILAFVAGVCALQLLPAWPCAAWPRAVVGTLLLGLLALCAGCAGSRPRPFAFAVGLLWAGWQAQLGLAARLPTALAGVALRVEGRIVDLPVMMGGALRFELRVQSVARGIHPGPPLRRLALVDYAPLGEASAAVTAGARCTLHVRLRPPRGLRNPAGVDVERVLFARRIDATGYVIAHPANRCTPAPFAGAVDRLRLRIAAAIDAGVEDPATAAVLRALAVGAQAALDSRQWQVLQATGTTHVVSISGLHVSMVAIAAHAAVRVLFALWPAATRRIAAQAAGNVVGLVAAAGYAALAGLAVPTQRTLLMLACMVWQRRRGQRLLNADGLVLALGIVVLIDPLAILTTSLWLSFGAMAALVLLAALLRAARMPLRALGVHLWLALLLAPLLALVSPFIAWTSPLANLVVVPLVTWGVVPLTLLGIGLLGLDATAATHCWHYAGALWQGAWLSLAWLADRAPPWRLPWAIPVACIPLLWLGLSLPLLPLGRFRLVLAALLLASPWLVPPPRLAPGALRVTVYDVGQGLAVLVRTRKHALLYDAGPRGSGGRDAGRAVVVPNLRAAGLWRLDRLVISHADIDHAGGAASVLAGVAVATTLVSPGDPAPPPGARRCAAGQRWTWDAVRFEILHPPPRAGGDDNQRSCVLSVTGAGGHRVLLTGDIDVATETGLLLRRAALAAEVLVTPHHGSRSSSSTAFVAAVGAHEVVHSAAHANRYGFPAPEVVARYAASGARQHVTGTHGAIEIELPGEIDRSGRGATADVRVTRWRERQRHYWQAR